ncbi:GRAM domain-containing protein [Myroides sp. N17-2]|uniref:GRAM domain-containing protein n=1 Tax=Myroides sp. N17-2 TaxID=2030799 RepID=UPI000EFC2A49|nr:GRAM domain-containing protein [Myroides sp. N17-2]
MKIGNDTIGISNGDKVKLVLFFFVIYVLIMLGFDWLFDGAIKSWENYLLKGLIYSLLLSGLMYYSIKTLTKRVELKLQIPLAEGEELEAYGVANMFLGKEAIGGKLGITEDTLVFHSHKFNIQRSTIRIPFEDIKSIKPCKVMWILSNGIEVRTDAERCVFVVNDRKAWLEVIKQKIK